MGGTAPVPDFKIEAKGVGGEGHPEAKRKARAGGSKHVDFPRRGKSTPIRPSLFSPSERNRARSGLIGVFHPLPFALTEKWGQVRGPSSPHPTLYGDGP